MRLTADILLRAENYLNPLKERELSLRGFKIAAIENLSILQDQFDVIDFSDNEIRLLDNFPRMRRLSTILINNNYIFRIGNIGHNLTNLTTLILTNNRITNLSEIDHLASLSNLELLSLMDNPVTNLNHYRLYVIYKIPSLKCLDFQKVTKTEREQSKALFESQEGSSVLNEVEREKNQILNEEMKESKNSTTNELTESQKEYIRSVIESTQTKEDMDRIETQLRSGSFPFPPHLNGHTS